MNERIKELAERARAQVHEIYKTMEEEPIGNFIDWFDEQFEQKFAELLIRECAQVFEAEVDTWKEMDPYQGSMKRKGAQAIKQHFGVEE
jgi:hypothetical protein